MTDRRVDGFFDGLYMDLELLREAGVAPARPRRAYVDDFALRPALCYNLREAPRPQERNPLEFPREYIASVK